MKKMIRILPIIWILFGLLFFAYGRYGYYLLLNANENSQNNQHTIESPASTDNNFKEKNEAATKVAAFNEAAIRPVEAKDYADAQLAAEKIIQQWGIGSIYIPSSDIKTKILAGMSNENLIVAVGTYQANQIMGEGNYVVLAHNLVEGGGTLLNLTKTELGSIIYMTDFSTVYEYQVTVNRIEEQTNGELLMEPKKGEKGKATLFRCEGGIDTPNRAVVQGEFIKSYPAMKATKQVLAGLGLVKGSTSSDKTSDIDINENGKNSISLSREESGEAPVLTQEITLKQDNQMYNLIEVGAIKTFRLIEQNSNRLIFIYIIFLILLFSLQKLF